MTDRDTPVSGLAPPPSSTPSLEELWRRQQRIEAIVQRLAIHTERTITLTEATAERSAKQEAQHTQLEEGMSMVFQALSELRVDREREKADRSKALEELAAVRRDLTDMNVHMFVALERADGAEKIAAEAKTFSARSTGEVEIIKKEVLQAAREVRDAKYKIQSVEGHVDAISTRIGSTTQGQLLELERRRSKSEEENAKELQKAHEYIREQDAKEKEHEREIEKLSKQLELETAKSRWTVNTKIVTGVFSAAFLAFVAGVIATLTGKCG